ncbi:MAG: hypothetical protein HY785_18890 [Oscillatoriophycideae cyanobacterium NC_groundwater_1537_Pr4_S-0.65um_50_18]|nr:hypothetical protein [Oscillatoriophycideae cyanobacterium NC_groundwater_1537_Pr4_S-0.65um_50_18]
MVEAICSIPVPQTTQELELAIRRYKASDIRGTELFCQWQAIRDAALALKLAESSDDFVAGEESY